MDRLDWAQTLRVTVDKLAKAYGFLWALRDLEIDLAAGESVALLGPNGAGKTTFLRLLAGLQAPTRGFLRLDGETFSPGRAQMRARIGLLAPADHLYENLTVRENLLFFTRLYGRSLTPSTLSAVLEEVNLLHRSEEFAANLSSGMKCRLSIAKWRLLDPELLLLDEPYGVLDGGGIDLLEAFLRSQCAKGAIAIVASHHVSRVLQLCSRALILSQGRLTFDDTKKDPWPAFDRAFREFLPRGES